MANAKAETARRLPDVIKWTAALGVLAAAMVGYYYFSESSQLLRIVALLAALGVSIAIIYQTEKGRLAWMFIREARTEVRKVVWPTRKETGQTTLIVMLVVTVVAIILWIFDGILTYLVRLLLGTGS
ncbi:MAG: preprotein translocase subunit SecE [Gammaproteobacteria bacterium]|jgi:preprotein translocase subunit SecE